MLCLPYEIEVAISVTENSGMSCHLDRYQCFWGTCCLHHQVKYYFPTLKMEAAYSSRTLVPNYIIPEANTPIPLPMNRSPLSLKWIWKWYTVSTFYTNNMKVACYLQFKREKLDSTKYKNTVYLHLQLMLPCILEFTSSCCMVQLEKKFTCCISSQWLWLYEANLSSSSYSKCGLFGTSRPRGLPYVAVA
jgi:hypothetical protein